MSAKPSEAAIEAAGRACVHGTMLTGDFDLARRVLEAAYAIDAPLIAAEAREAAIREVVAALRRMPLRTRVAAAKRDIECEFLGGPDAE